MMDSLSQPMYDSGWFAHNDILDKDPEIVYKMI